MNGSGGLKLVARIPAPSDACHIQSFAIGPDPANPGDRTLAQGDSKGGEIEVFGGRDLGAPTAFAAALTGGAGFFAEIGGPDDVPAQPHPAIEARDHGPFCRRGNAQTVEPRALDALGRA